MFQTVHSLFLASREMAILIGMDELVIDDKKYVSSKRAAKITGYAKDYIGQLCREGRVTARLVGRSGYVLESAIHDHRFGDKEDPAAPSPSAAVFSSTWGEPKYEPDAVSEPLPAIEKDEDEPREEPADTASRLQDSWKAWFERVGEPSAVPAESEVEQKEEKESAEESVSVPIRAIHHEQYQPLPHEILPRRTEIPVRESRGEALIEEHLPRRSGGSRLMLQLSGALLAVAITGLAVAGTGYFDRYILASQHFGALAGVSFYSR